MSPSTLNLQIHPPSFHQSVVLVLPCETDKRLRLFYCWILNVLAEDNTLLLLCIDIALIAWLA